MGTLIIASCCEDVQNGCETSNKDCSKQKSRERRQGVTQRSMSSSSDETFFVMEIEKEDTEEKTSETEVNVENQDDKPAEETKSRKHPRFVHQDSWKHALKKAMSMPDPWEVFHLEMCSQETATRHRYNALKKTWVLDKIKIRMGSVVSKIHLVY